VKKNCILKTAKKCKAKLTKNNKPKQTRKGKKKAKKCNSRGYIMIEKFKCFLN